jgi:hypothetical protein
MMVIEMSTEMPMAHVDRVLSECDVLMEEIRSIYRNMVMDTELAFVPAWRRSARVNNDAALARL